MVTYFMKLISVYQSILYLFYKIFLLPKIYPQKLKIYQKLANRIFTIVLFIILKLKMN